MVWQVGRIGDRRSFFLATTLLPTSLQITPRFDTFLACLFFFLRCNNIRDFEYFLLCHCSHLFGRIIRFSSLKDQKEKMLVNRYTLFYFVPRKNAEVVTQIYRFGIDLSTSRCVLIRDN